MGLSLVVLLLLSCALLRISSTKILINKQNGKISSCKYTLVREHRSREAAASYCEELEGTLAVINSEQENKEVLSLLRKAKQDKAWIGLFLTPDETRWDTGTALTFSKFDDEGQDIEASGVNVLITKTGHWTTSAQKQQASFVCSIRQQYMVVTDLLTHKQSKDRCQASNLTLGRVKNIKDIKSVRRLLSHQDTPVSKKYLWFWIDGENPTASGTWQYSDGSPMHNIRWEKEVSFPREGPVYTALNRRTGRNRPLHDYFLNPAICECQDSDTQQSGPAAQSDYGQINSRGEYVPLFRSIQNRRRRIGLEHDHDNQISSGGRLRYKYYDLKYTHGFAQLYCQNQGGDLACPRNSLQHTQILETIKSNSWLGIADVDEEGRFMCIGENSPLEYTNWYHRFGYGAVPEPDNMTDRMKPGASYVQILYDPERQWRHGKWIDRGSPQYEFVVKSAFVCEFRVAHSVQ